MYQRLEEKKKEKKKKKKEKLTFTKTNKTPFPTSHLNRVHFLPLNTNKNDVVNKTKIYENTYRRTPDT